MCIYFQNPTYFVEFTLTLLIYFKALKRISIRMVFILRKLELKENISLGPTDNLS